MPQTTKTLAQRATNAAYGEFILSALQSSTEEQATASAQAYADRKEEIGRQAQLASSPLRWFDDAHYT